MTTSSRTTRRTAPGSAVPGSAVPGSAVPGSAVPGSAVPGSAYALLGRARAVLADADAAESAADRFCLAHLAALRIAAAVLADRGRPAASRRRLVSAWLLLDTVAPEYADWAVYFAAGAASRAAVEAGALGVVTPRDADDQLRAAHQFLVLVESAFGLLAVPIAS